MTKLLITSPVLYTFWNYTTYAFLAIVLAIVIIDLITRVLDRETPSESNYEAVKEIFNNPNSTDYIGTKVTVTKLEVVSVDFNLFSYRELQASAKSLDISGRSRKRVVLEQELLALCK